MIHPDEGYRLYKSRRQRPIYHQHMYKHSHDYQRIQQEYREAQAAREHMAKTLQKYISLLGDGLVTLGRHLQKQGLASPIA